VLSVFSLQGKKAVVVGASRGIGRAIAVALAEAGAELALASRSVSDLNQAAEEIRQAGGSALVIPVDVSQPAQIDPFAGQCFAALGRVDVLINDVGVNPSRRKFEESLDEEWQVILDVNLKGTMCCLKAFGQRMIAQGGGSIVNITSTASMRGAPTLAAYGATKGALGVLTQSLALEWAQHGVRVNALAPGYVTTALTRKVWTNPELYEKILAKIPLRRFARPEEIAPAAVFLASDASSYMTGSTLVVDGGWTAQ
jgi:NAD(P)-dependent dehydrogenase (short-subunit alcohol dehydrogenase family)